MRRMALAGLSLALVSHPAHAQWRTAWTYDGPRGSDHWGDLDPDYIACKTGKAQSPIDIAHAEQATLPAIHFENHAEPLKYLINNGATIRVNYHDAPGTGSFLVVGDKRYQLTQFHFHRPSEEYVRGKPYDMEAHFMYKAADGEVAGVTVFLTPGAPSHTVQQLWDHMPRAKSDELEIPSVEIDPSDLFPRDLAYYMYSGSVTAPPCTEGVLWLILKSPVEISAEQIKAFAELYPHDVRPLQPLNGRIVKETQ